MCLATLNLEVEILLDKYKIKDMIATKHDIEGKLTIKICDVDGNLIEEKETYNSITTVGRKLVTDLFKFNIIDAKEDKIKRISTMHLGKSNKGFKPNQTAMQDYVGLTKIETVEYVPTGNDRVRLRLVGELDTDNCNDSLQEAGLFTEDEPPIMYNRVTFDTITKSKEFKLTLIWEITF